MPAQPQHPQPTLYASNTTITAQAHTLTPLFGSPVPLFAFLLGVFLSSLCAHCLLSSFLGVSSSLEGNRHRIKVKNTPNSPGQASVAFDYAPLAYGKSVPALPASRRTSVQ